MCVCVLACVRVCVCFSCAVILGVSTSVIRGGFTVAHVRDVVCNELYVLTALRARQGALPGKKFSFIDCFITQGEHNSNRIE